MFVSETNLYNSIAIVLYPYVYAANVATTNGVYTGG